MSTASSIHRRGFLAGAAATACATGFAGNSIADARTPLPNSLFDLTRDDFSKLLGSSFLVSGPTSEKVPGAARLVLRQAKSCAHPSDKLRPAQLRREGFSLLFEAPAETSLADGMHLVSGAGFPPCHLLLHACAAGRFPHGKVYEAIFN